MMPSKARLSLLHSHLQHWLFVLRLALLVVGRVERDRHGAGCQERDAVSEILMKHAYNSLARNGTYSHF